MKKALENVAFTFAKTFAAALVVVLAGVSAQPSLHEGIAFAVAGVMAAGAAGLSAILTFVPALTFQRWIKDPYGKILDAFSHGFLTAFLVSVIGFLHNQDLAVWRAAVTGALVGAISAGFRAVQGGATLGEKPAPGTGVIAVTPPPPAATKAAPTF